MEAIIAIIGFVVGIMVGLTGVGGAALLTPILILIGVQPTIAVGTDLVYNSLTKLFGTYQHWKQKTVNWKLVLYLSYGSIPGAVAAIVIIKTFDHFFQNQEHIIQSALGMMLVIVSLTIIFKQLFPNKVKENRWQSRPLNEKIKMTIGIGFVLGFIVGLTSIGSGSLFAIAFLYFYRMHATELVGTDIAHAFFLATAAGLMHAGLGHVDYVLAANLLLGSIPGVVLGSSLSAKVKTRPLRTIIATIILISGVRLI